MRTDTVVDVGMHTRGSAQSPLPVGHWVTPDGEFTIYDDYRKGPMFYTFAQTPRGPTRVSGFLRLTESEAGLWWSANVRHGWGQLKGEILAVFRVRVQIDGNALYQHYRPNVDSSRRILKEAWREEEAKPWAARTVGPQPQQPSMLADSAAQTDEPWPQQPSMLAASTQTDESWPQQPSMLAASTQSDESWPCWADWESRQDARAAQAQREAQAKAGVDSEQVHSESEREVDANAVEKLQNRQATACVNRDDDDDGDDESSAHAVEPEQGATTGKLRSCFIGEEHDTEGGPTDEDWPVHVCLQDMLIQHQDSIKRRLHVVTCKIAAMFKAGSDANPQEAPGRRSQALAEAAAPKHARSCRSSLDEAHGSSGVASAANDATEVGSATEVGVALDNFDEDFTGAYSFEPPHGPSWEWPLSRGEIRNRIQILAQQELLVQQQEMAAHLEQLWWLALS